MKSKITLLFYLLIAISITKISSQTVSTFENLALTPNSYWNGLIEPLGSSFYSGNATFTNYYDTTYGGYWASGFAYSNVQDTNTSGMGNMYASIAGSGYNGSSNYIVGEVDAFRQVNPKIILNSIAQGKMMDGAFFTNSTYSAISMRDGDLYGKKFGGTTGNDPDWFKLTIKKWLNGSLGNDSVEFYLADFRSSNNSEDYIVKDWRWVDLKTLGNVDSLTFIMTSSDVGTFGINTPLFFCIDHFTTLDQGVNISENQMNKINVYPNPTTEILNINATTIGEKEVEIYDNTGRLIIKSNFISLQLQINVSSLLSGIYHVKIQENAQLTKLTFIKQ